MLRRESALIRNTISPMNIKLLLCRQMGFWVVKGSATLLAPLILLLTSLLASAEDRPNFLVIIADDMGFSDAGCYGGEITTPNLDALAEGGLRFTQFYNTSRCWPTRAALLTGYYPQQVRRDGMPGAPPNFGGAGKRPAWAQTIAQHLRPTGYRTYHSGKWHIDGKPTENGFDLSNEISRAPHFPLHALPEDIAKYQDHYTEGWDVLRTQRHQRQRSLGLDVANLSPLEPEVGPPYAFPDQIAMLGPGEVNRPLPWQQLTEQQQRFQAKKMAIHAAMVDRMDREIGRVLDQLRNMNAMDNTFICFLSDNGASAEMMVRGDGHDPAAAPGSAETYLCLGPGFSSAANTPFRRHKTWVHEGGISTPFIVHWPNGIKAKNEFRSTIAHVVDIAPTVLDLAGEKPDMAAAPPISGTSLRPALAEDGVTLHDELWFYHKGNRALRQGAWKIIDSNITRGRKRCQVPIWVFGQSMLSLSCHFGT